MDDIGIGLLVLVLFLGLFFGGHWTGKLYYHKLTQEAFERGHMVQCPGVTGYHWECEQ